MNEQEAARESGLRARVVRDGSTTEQRRERDASRDSGRQARPTN